MENTTNSNQDETNNKPFPDDQPLNTSIFGLDDGHQQGNQAPQEILPESQETKKKNNVLIILAIALVLMGSIGFFAYDRLSANADSAALADSTLTDDFNENKQKVFSIAAYDKIPEDYRRSIYKFFKDNQYDQTGEYFLTKIPARVHKIYCFGNFSNRADYTPETSDIAFLIEKNDFKSSAIVIMDANANLLFFKEYDNELPVINSFKKGAEVFLGNTYLEKAKIGGIIVQSKDRKTALLYNNQTNVFDEFYQYTKEDLEHYDYESDYEEPDAYLEEFPEVGKDTIR